MSYETIVWATRGNLEAVNEVLWHYSKCILINGHIDKNTEDSTKQRLVTVLLKFCFDEQKI